jgi:hypothetical protein
MIEWELYLYREDMDIARLKEKPERVEPPAMGNQAQIGRHSGHWAGGAGG